MPLVTSDTDASDDDDHDYVETEEALDADMSACAAGGPSLLDADLDDPLAVDEDDDGDEQDEEDVWAEERRYAEILYEAAKSRHQQRGQAKAARMASLAHKRIAPAPRGVDSDETSAG